MGRLAQTLGVSHLRISASESNVALNLSASSFSPHLGVTRFASVFLFIASQHTRRPACGLSVLRRPAHLGGVAPTSSQRRKNSSSARCCSTSRPTAVTCNAGGAAPRCGSALGKTASSAALIFRVASQATVEFQTLLPNAKVSPVSRRGARAVAQQCGLAARRSQCTPNHSLNRTHCGRPAFGLKQPSPHASLPQWAG